MVLICFEPVNSLSNIRDLLNYVSVFLVIKVFFTDYQYKSTFSSPTLVYREVFTIFNQFST